MFYYTVRKPEKNTAVLAAGFHYTIHFRSVHNHFPNNSVGQNVTQEGKCWSKAHPRIHQELTRVMMWVYTGGTRSDDTVIVPYKTSWKSGRERLKLEKAFA
jgi:hypothetical protein